VSTHHRVFRLDELAAGSARRVTLDGIAIAVVRIDDDVYAIGDTCSHADVSLSEGFVDTEQCAIECSRHGAYFDLATGGALTLPAVKPVPRFDAAVLDGDVVITINEAGS